MVEAHTRHCAGGREKIRYDYEGRIALGNAVVLGKLNELESWENR